MENRYSFKQSGEIITPALIYYRDIIKENTRKAIALAHGPQHLWPHVKTHKMAQMIHLQMAEGITRFKCATIAEAEMAAGCGAGDVLIAYPMIGPNIGRFIQLQKAFPDVRFYTIGDEREQLSQLGTASARQGIISQVLLDIDMGMNRTGVSLENAEAFYVNCTQIEGLKMRGLHCYDGHRTEQDIIERKAAAAKNQELVMTIRKHIQDKQLTCDIMVMGGTPSFPCYADIPDVYFSPGTLFVNDYGYSKKFPDLTFIPGAAVLTRVISCPQKGHFTLDLGYKGIAADPGNVRGIIAGMEHITELFQSEEHWAYSMEPGYEDECPHVGDELYVVPTHICPTSALYPSVIVVEHEEAVARWSVTARNRKITY